jgi:ABC-type bacteriocin/lantibiotic exporter with double-glycine peptidase domain
MWYSKSSGSWPEISNAVFISVFAGIITLILIVFFVRGIVFTLMVIAKSVDLHNKMFKSVVYASMGFFDTTPIGRVLNAFSRHMYAIDVTVSDSLFQMLLFLPVTAGAIALIIANMYQTIGVFGGAAVIACLILLFLGKIEDRLKNREALTRSTIFSHLTATLEGLYSIRAYQCQERFVVNYREKIDENHKYQFSMMEGRCSNFLYCNF